MSRTPPKPLTVSSPHEREIRIERVFHASRERVWRALTDPAQVSQWWCRGNPLVIERMDVVRGGHWRFVEHSPQGTHGFEGRYSEVVAPERIVQTFEWDGMPGHVALETLTLEDLGDGRTRMVVTSLFHTIADRDGMLRSGMAQGAEQSYRALDRLLAGPSVWAALSVCLWFNGQAEDAARFYTELLPGGRVLHVSRYGEGAPFPAGTALSVEFVLDGRTFLALNGGPHHTLTPAFSIVLTRDTQHEIDALWERLVEGGRPSQCGWLTDRFGVSWQVVPRALPAMITSGDGARVGRLMAAMMPMQKLDLAALQAAFDEG